MKKLQFFLLAVMVLTLTGLKTLGQTTLYPVDGPIQISPGEYNMTPTAGVPGCRDQSGALWNDIPINFNYPFILTFQASFDNETTPGADGIMLIFGQNIITTTLPVITGGELGYYDTLDNNFNAHSFGVELDIYDDFPCCGPYWHDTTYDHTSVVENANPFPMPSTPAAPTPINGTAGVRDGTYHNYMVKWDPGTHLLQVYYECNLIIQSDATTWTTPTGAPLPIATLLPGLSGVYWGFTSSTGDLCSNQKLKDVNMNVLSTVCVGSTISLSYSPAGGTWSSSITTVATVNTTGTVTGVSAGTTVITYSSGGCVMTTSVTVIPSPSAVAGPSSVCLGTTITLSDATPYGVWTSSNTTIATVGLHTGVVTGVSDGTVNITYSIGSSGCQRVDTITVSGAISGPATVCSGTNITLSDYPPGGTWSSSNTSIATVVSSTGSVIGGSSGVVTISYTSPAGCLAITTVTVNPSPAYIGGAMAICADATTTLTDAAPGGIWGGGYPTIATVGSSTGVVTAGAVTVVSYVPILYTLSDGCITGTNIEVDPDPSAIAPVTLCQGTTITLSNAVAGGEWSSSNAGVANIGIFSGAVTGISGGSAIITYMMDGGCFATTTVTVNPAPGTITGTTTVCAGSTTYLSEATAGGIWSSSSTSIAVIGTTGVVTGISGGIAYITYTIGTGCFTTTTVTVNALPTSVTGTDSICVGNTTILSDAVSPGTWSSSNTTVATVGSVSGIVTGVSAGVSSITYTLTDGCGAATATVTVKVDPLPDSIVGAMPVCAGSTITLSDGTPYGTWSSSYTTIATAGSGTGVVTGVNMGTTVITYSLPTGCFMTTSVMVNPLPDPITGITQVCINSTTALSDDIAGGIWTSSNTSVATIDGSSGIVTGMTPGTVVVTYTLGTGCFVTTTVTVNPLPGTITGIGTICAGSTTTLSDATADGTWTSGNTTIVVIGGTGIVTGISAGMAVITYTLVTGCYATTTVTVNPTPSITGSVGTCADSTIVLSSDIGGGTWVSSNTTVATVDPVTGDGTGITTGTTVITYTLSTGCAATLTLTVNPVPSISGGDSVCVGSTINLSDDVAGGAWTSSNTAVATVGSTGVVTGVMTGSTDITYMAGGCFSTYTVTVDTGLFLDMGASGTVYPGCPIPVNGNVTPVGATITSLMWSSSNTSVATVSPVYSYTTTVTMASDTGISVITLTATNACGVFTGSFTVTADTLPTLSIGGPATICAGSDIVLSSSPSGNYWTSSNVSVATVDFSSGEVTGINPGGTSIITYNYEAGSCLLTATTTVTVNPQPGPITGGSSVCIGSSITLSDDMAGGTWTSSNTGVAVVDGSSGVVTGISGSTTSFSGPTYITYTMSGGCYSVDTITVNLSPPTSFIVGPDTLCVGSMISLYDSTSSFGVFIMGTWSSSNTLLATVDAFGDVYGVIAGTVVISYGVSNGICATTVYDTIQVLTTPAVPPVTGVNIICLPGTTALSDALAGGTWNSYNPGIASVDPVTGIVTGVSPGTAVIVYNTTDYCGPIEIWDTVQVISQNPPITGVMAVCSGTTTTLSNIIGGGVWSSSNTALATVNPGTGIVTGVGTGIDTITYIATNVCGTFTVSVPVSVNMPPYITTNFVVACQTLGSSEEFGHILNDSAGCIEVCQNRLIRYYGNGVAGSVFSWVVSGGTIVTNYGDSIDVIWPTAGVTGSITLFDSAGSCSGSYNVCILVISAPVASFTATEINTCVNNPVSFTSTSTGDPLSPIVSYYWNFGDGSFSSDENPTHTFTTPNSNDTVTLVVKNACGCTDTFRMVLNIIGFQGIPISCPSIVCEGQSTTYTCVDTSCTGSYLWSVNGGTIVSGAGTASITVDWNNVSQDGYGYVNVLDPCARCPDTNTIKIPVILATDTITGPDTVCTGNQYEYSLPLWPATQYMWGVLADHGAIVGYDNDYRVTLNFSTPGIYLLHGWYQNVIGLCGANLYKTIRVFPTTSIAGQTIICLDNTETFTVGGGLSARWTLSSSSGTPITTSTGTSFHYSFTTIGSYVLTATGNFCADAIVITVIPRTTPIDSLIGPDTVCLNRVYQYIVYTPPLVPVSWSAVGGTVSVSSGMGTDTVNVIWDSSGAKELVVIAPNPCGNPDTVAMNIVQEVINPTVTGDNVPCANSHRTYSTAYTRAEVYDWTIYPTTAGSVLTGDHTTSVNVLWNDNPGTTPLTAGVVLTVHKCDSVVSDTLWVNVQPDPAITISSSLSPACPGTVITFTASTGGSSYAWNFGDGSPLVTTGNTVTHLFPLNTTTGNASYLVTVRVMPDTTAICPIAGYAALSEVILPGPVDNVSSGSLSICVSPALLLGTVTNNIGPLTYQWYDNGTPISGATTVSYTASATGPYTLVVTAGNGCTSADSVRLDTCGNDVAGCGSTLHPTITTIGCNEIYMYVYADGGISPAWVAYQTPADAAYFYNPTFLNTAAFLYNEPGIYNFQFHEFVPGTDDTCQNQANVSVELDGIASFVYHVKCSTGGMDSVFLSDNSAYLAGWNISTYSWSEATLGALGTTANVNLAVAAPGTYVVTETVTFTGPGPTFSCDATHTLTLPAPPTATAAAFTYTTSPICEGLPVTFTPTTTTGLLSYSWNFGDGSSSLLQNTQRTYTWNPLLIFNPQFDTVTLIVTDSLGCTAQTSATVQVQENLFNDGASSVNPLNQIVCSPDAPATLTFLNGTIYAVSTYLWSNGAVINPISVNTSGAYWVTVTGSYGCQATIPTPAAAEVTIVHMPPVSITGNTGYCYGQTVQLSSNVGSGVAYQWYRNGLLDGNGPTISDAGLAVGDYTYQLVISAIDSASAFLTPVCTETASVVVHIYDQPLPPVITGPVVLNCSAYQLQLTATDALPGNYNWSDGNIGAIDNIDAGGFYEVWLTSLSGCKSLSSSVYVPQDPNIALQYFPTGCYNLCVERAPLTVYGPPDQLFYPWAWILNGSVVSTGTGLMAPYAVDAVGDYQWQLFNGLCQATSGTADVTAIKCNNCGNATLSARLTCDILNPASYIATVTLYSPAAGTTYTIGTNMGPILPFSGTFSGSGTYVVTLTYTTLMLPPPASVEIEVQYNIPGDPVPCFQSDTVRVPACIWIPERIDSSGDTAIVTPITAPAMNTIATAMLVFPNPASGEVTISYDYGSDGSQSRALSIYDEMGRKTQSTIPTDVHGNWSLNTTNWMPGIYIVRMEGDGQALQTQRVVITH